MSAVVHTIEGETVDAKESFLDEYDEPLELSPDSAGPIVRLYDLDNDIVAEEIGVPDPSGQPGDWLANIPVPVLNLQERVELKLTWEFRSDEGDLHRSRQVFFVEPAQETRISDIVVMVEQDRRFEVVLPFVPDLSKDKVEFGIFQNNKPLFKDTYIDASKNGAIRIENGLDRAVASLPNVLQRPKLEPYLLTVRFLRNNMVVPQLLNYKIWPATPQMLVASTMIEDHINKARLANVIPELDYAQGDLFTYMSRGLSMFNSLPPHLTAFDGTNMQGQILGAWVDCSCYYALAAQLQAEGAMSFDFSGQSVSLNVDRTPQIEGALGRIEGQIESTIKPFKKLLARAGVLDGNGSQGGQYINGSKALGRLTITNSPTSRVGSRGRNKWYPGGM